MDVASFGDAFAQTPGALDVVYADPVAGVYKKLVLSDDAQTLLGGILVGDASAYGMLRPLVGGPLGADPAAYLMPEGAGDALANAELPDEALVCSCNSVTAGTIRCAVTDEGCTDVAGVKACTRAGAACGSCLPLVKKLVGTELARSGASLSTALCEHFTHSRAQLFDAVRVSGLRTFSAIIERFGTGRGCDICKPVLASILSSLGHGHVLDGENATLQDTNDHVMANIQKDGSYSVVPRIAGGEITPEGLLVIGQVAKDFGLYTKITGGQRIDMFGARLEQLPEIWKRLVDAGFESGHAYGKSLRTVKSCVGSTWCRYGVQDSVGMAVQLELRYRGLRSPHKIKLGVSGCARECAEARGKDVGVIATEAGWNMYVGGNGGFTPRHAVLFAEGLDDAALLQAIDRFLMYYIRTADRLQRTAPWFEEMEGGIEALRAVIFEDSLGICADLDAAMAHARRRLRGRVEGDARGPREAAPVRLVRQRPDDTRPLARLHVRARTAASGDRRRARRAARAHRRHARWRCADDRAAEPHRDGGPAAGVADRSPAPAARGLGARVPSRRPRASSGASPPSSTASRSRCSARTTTASTRSSSSTRTAARTSCRAGIVGTRGDAPTVASPMYKQVFDLRTGACLETQGKDAHALQVWPVAVDAERRRAREMGGAVMTTMIGISLAGRQVVMVGGGDVAARRIRRFLARRRRRPRRRARARRTRRARLVGDNELEWRARGVDAGRPRRRLARAHRHGRSARRCRRRGACETAPHPLHQRGRRQPRLGAARGRDAVGRQHRRGRLGCRRRPRPHAPAARCDRRAPPRRRAAAAAPAPDRRRARRTSSAAARARST